MEKEYYYVSGSTLTQTTKTYNKVRKSATYTTYTTGTDTNLSSKTGTITLDYIKKGIYYIYEVETGSEPPYFLEDQEEASTEPTGLQDIMDVINPTWKYKGYIQVDATTNPGNRATTIHTSSSTTTTKIINYKRIKISGYVWVDEDLDKNDEYNNVYDQGSEVLVEGVKVYLYNKSTGKVTSTDGDTYVTTDENGEYTFGYEWKILYKDIADYYIEFDYGSASGLAFDSDASAGKNYFPVAFNSEFADEIVTNGSRALMDKIYTNDTALDGLATTYTGTNTSYETIYGLSGNLFDKYYSSSLNTLQYINLGLIPIYEPDYLLTQDILYVQIVEDDTQYIYDYATRKSHIVKDDEVLSDPSVAYQHANIPAEYTVYTRAVYASSIASKALGNTFEVYVVYEITIQNTTSYNVENRYMESSLCITSLYDTFDSDRYELCTDTSIPQGLIENVYGDDADDIYNCFNKWTTVSGSTNKVKYKNTTFSLDPYTSDESTSSDSKCVYIQFNLTADAIAQILENPDGITTDYPTYATTTGYHKYYRYDWDWTLDGSQTYYINNDESYVIEYNSESKDSNYLYDTIKNSKLVAKQKHNTENVTKTASAPYMRFKLADTDRQITGIVFEDEDATSSDNDEIGNDTLGNGIYDSTENTVENVVVTLVDEEENDVYQNYVYDSSTSTYYIYDQDTGSYYKYSGSNGEYTVISKPSTVDASQAISYTTGDDGEYTLSQIATGSYKLKFTYYDENNTTGLQTKIDGETISINDYKSTIVTSESVADAIKDPDNNDGLWYQDYDGDSNYYESDEYSYSTATDDLDLRETYNEGIEYNYDIYDDGTYNEEDVEVRSYDANGTEITSMEAYTPVLFIAEENTKDNFKNTDSDTVSVTYYASTENGYVYTSKPSDYSASKYNIIIAELDLEGVYLYEGFNFGIIEQPEQSVDVEKEITNVKLINTPLTIFDGNPEDGLTGVSDLDGSTNGGSTYTRVELQEDYIYGSTLTVTYELKITNTSDLNYYETDEDYYGWYYMFGLHGDAYSSQVEITLDSVLDGYDPDLTWVVADTSLTSQTYTITSSIATTSSSSTTTSSSSSTITIDTEDEDTFELTLSNADAEEYTWYKSTDGTTYTQMPTRTEQTITIGN